MEKKFYVFHPEKESKFRSCGGQAVHLLSQLFLLFSAEWFHNEYHQSFNLALLSDAHLALIIFNVVGSVACAYFLGALNVVVKICCISIKDKKSKSSGYRRIWLADRNIRSRVRNPTGSARP